MQRVYRDPSNSRSLKLRIYLRSIQFLLPTKLLYPSYQSIMGSSFGSLPLRSTLSICNMAQSLSVILYVGFFPLILCYINAPKCLKVFFYFLFLFFLFMFLFLFFCSVQLINLKHRGIPCKLSHFQK